MKPHIELTPTGVRIFWNGRLVASVTGSADRIRSAKRLCECYAEWGWA